MHFAHQPRDWRRRILLFLAIAALTFFYLHPGGEALFKGRTDTVMSDDTDPSTLPYFYDGLLETWKDHKSWFFYGSVYNEGRTPDGAWAFWAPWLERFVVPFMGYFFPVEQLTTAFVFTLLMLNFFAMYALCRFMSWPRWLSLGLSLSWAFCAFTRARAKVHGALAGTFHIPLIFLGLLLLARGKTWRSLVGAILLFLFTVSTAHYYIVTSAFLAPFFLIFYFLQEDVRADLKRASLRLMIALAPTVAFLSYNYLKPLPSGAKVTSQGAIPKGGETKDGSVHPFLSMFAARPIDYLAGDIAMGPSDINPLRGALNTYILTHLDNSNPHERANGIRWIILFIAGFAIVLFFQKRFAQDGPTRLLMWFFITFAAFTFWLSLPPDIPFAKAGPSYWLYSLMNQVRVSSRAGIWVHFSLLFISGLFLYEMHLRRNPIRQKGKTKAQEGAPVPKVVRWLLVPAVLPAIVLLELPPFMQDMPMAPVRPRIASLQKGKGECGAGMYFPYVGPTWQLREHYHFIQQMRGSDCIMLNNALEPSRADWLLRRFALHPQVLEAIQQNDIRLLNSLESAARCIPMTWLYFDERVPQAWREAACRRLGWNLNADNTCTSSQLNQPMSRLPEQCP